MIISVFISVFILTTVVLCPTFWRKHSLKDDVLWLMHPKLSTDGFCQIMLKSGKINKILEFQREITLYP